MFFSAPPLHSLELIAHNLRLDILKAVYQSGSGHIGGALSSLDIINSLYHNKLFDFDIDHFILSAGHLCLAHFAVLAETGKFSSDLLKKYTDLGSLLEGHESTDVPGVEFSSGSLGQGLSFAAGLALGDTNHHTVCLTSDGEHNEGQIWEAIMFANKYHLGNLINIIDYNGFQIDGKTSDIMPINDLAAKYAHFNWKTIIVDGHNYYQLEKAYRRAKNSTIYPVCIIAKTILGKGISFMENNYHYHDVKDLSPDLYQKAINELE